MVPVKIITLLGLTVITAVIASPIDTVSAVDHVVLPKPHLECTLKTCGLDGCKNATICQDRIPPRPRPVCTAATCGLKECANSETCLEIISQCAEVGDCPPDLNCPVELCELTICSNSPPCIHGEVKEASLDKRQNSTRKPDCNLLTCDVTHCSDSVYCGQNSSTIFTEICLKNNCSGELLDFCSKIPACANQTEVTKREFRCPEGVKCGHGPVCTAATCHLEGCAKTPVCQNAPIKASSKRQFNCPAGAKCGHGPVCTGFDCEDPLCADAPSCKKGPARENTERQIPTLPGDGNPRCPHVCNTYPICICLPSSTPICDCAADPITNTGFELEGKLIPAHRHHDNLICAELCTKEGFCICEPAANCTCGANTSNWSPFDLVDAPPNDPVLHLSHNFTQPGESPPPNGERSVAPLSDGNGNGTSPHHVSPCPDICDENGNCGCDLEASEEA